MTTTIMTMTTTTLESGGTLEVDGASCLVQGAGAGAAVGDSIIMGSLVRPPARTNNEWLLQARTCSRRAGTDGDV